MTELLTEAAIWAWVVLVLTTTADTATEGTGVWRAVP